MKNAFNLKSVSDSNHCSDSVKRVNTFHVAQNAKDLLSNLTAFSFLKTSVPLGDGQLRRCCVSF